MADATSKIAYAARSQEVERYQKPFRDLDSLEVHDYSFFSVFIAGVCARVIVSNNLVLYLCDLFCYFRITGAMMRSNRHNTRE